MEMVNNFALYDNYILSFDEYNAVYDKLSELIDY